MADLKKILREEKIRNLKLLPPLLVVKATPLKEVVEAMKKNRKGYALVVEEERPIGIFTERDALTKVIEQKVPLSTPIENLMTPDPKVLKMDDSVAGAIRLMNKGGYRHVPIVDQEGKVQGMIRVRDIIQYLAEHFPYEVYNLPPDPHQIIRAPEGA